MSAAPRLTNTGMTETEWQTRCNLAALYRVVDHLGWTDLINTHMSARISGEPHTFLINRYGQMFDEITASSLVKLDMDGNERGGNGGPVNSAGFTIHSGVYKARPDANCVTHTHTRAGAGISLLKEGLRPISQDAISILAACRTQVRKAKPVRIRRCRLHDIRCLREGVVCGAAVRRARGRTSASRSTPR
jgi:ribulose-5-phosphate 4-epimerase/fuculose-1-phosphate aldolase